MTKITMDWEGKRVGGTWNGKPFTGKVEHVHAQPVDGERRYDSVGGYSYRPHVRYAIAITVELDRSVFREWQQSHITIRQEDVDDGDHTVEVTSC